VSDPRDTAPTWRLYAGVPGFPTTGAIDVVAYAVGLAEIELEIGFGRGRFALERAVVNPDALVLGVETRRKHVHTAAEVAATRGLTNVVFRHGDARELVARFTPDACCARIFINFPDPWWKARHAKRTVVTPALAGELARLLRPGGELFVQTDVAERAEAFHQVLGGEGRLAPSSGDGFVNENPYNAVSNRERRCIEVEVPIFRLRYLRV
jgi:tRNA (guanine-N7-)-methyltransferase